MGAAGPAEITAFLQRVFPGALDRFTIEAAGGRAGRVRAHFDERMLRPGGTISGPALMALADTAMWVALLAEVGLEPLTVTSNLNIDFLRKPMPGDVVAHATLLKVGKRLAVGTVLLCSDGDDQPVAHATVTYAIPSVRSTGG